jgi:hypothetical protein
MFSELLVIKVESMDKCPSIRDHSVSVLIVDAVRPYNVNLLNYVHWRDKLSIICH